MRTPRPTLRLLALSVATLATLSTGCGGGDALPPGVATVPTPPPATDTTAPALAISDNLSGATASGDITFTFTFSEDTGTTFSADDITVTGATKGSFTRVSGTQATLVVSPPALSAGTLQISIAAAAFSDAAGNANITTLSTSHSYNTGAPVASTRLVGFEEATAPVFTGFGGAEDAAVVVDPLDNTNKAGRITKSATAELWAGSTLSICPNNTLVALPFAAGQTTLSLRVLSPDANVPFRVKVEDASDGTKSVETEATVTTAGSWQTLEFNFANHASGTAAMNLATTYNKLSIFPNFGRTGAQVGSAKAYHVDELRFVGSSFTVACPATGGGGSSSAVFSFDEGTAPTLTGFGGAEDATVVADPAGGTNKVAKVVKAATAELWAGVTISKPGGLSTTAAAFTANNAVLTAKVWSPAAGTVVRMKFEDAADNSKTVETDATTTVANAWQTLSFNFATPASGTAALNLANTYNKLSVFFGFGTTGAAAGGARTYYLDEVSYPTATSGGSSGGTGTATSLPVSFDTAGVTYTLTGFGGAEDATVVADPTGGTNQVAKVVKSATAELWAGTTVSTTANLAIATVPFTASAKTMTLRVYAPAAGIPVRLKLEDAADNTKTVETEANTTVANAWHTLTFNFANPASGTAALNLATTYNKASVFFNFGKTGAAGGAGTYYFDDLAFVP
jgi:hypothetical protein